MSSRLLDQVRKRYNFPELSIASWRDPALSVHPARGGPEPESDVVPRPSYKVKYDLLPPLSSEDEASEDGEAPPEIVEEEFDLKSDLDLDEGAKADPEVDKPMEDSPPPAHNIPVSSPEGDAQPEDNIGEEAEHSEEAGEVLPPEGMAEEDPASSAVVENEQKSILEDNGEFLDTGKDITSPELNLHAASDDRIVTLEEVPEDKKVSFAYGVLDPKPTHRKKKAAKGTKSRKGRVAVPTHYSPQEVLETNDGASEGQPPAASDPPAEGAGADEGGDLSNGAMTSEESTDAAGPEPIDLPGEHGSASLPVEDTPIAIEAAKEGVEEEANEADEPDESKAAEDIPPAEESEPPALTEKPDAETPATDEVKEEAVSEANNEPVQELQAPDSGVEILLKLEKSSKKKSSRSSKDKDKMRKKSSSSRSKTKDSSSKSVDLDIEAMPPMKEDDSAPPAAPAEESAQEPSPAKEDEGGPLSEVNQADGEVIVDLDKASAVDDHVEKQIGEDPEPAHTDESGPPPNEDSSAGVDTPVETKQHDDEIDGPAAAEEAEMKAEVEADDLVGNDDAEPELLEEHTTSEAGEEDDENEEDHENGPTAEEAAAEVAPSPVDSGVGFEGEATEAATDPEKDLPTSSEEDGQHVEGPSDLVVVEGDDAEIQGGSEEIADLDDLVDEKDVAAEGTPVEEPSDKKSSAKPLEVAAADGKDDDTQEYATATRGDDTGDEAGTEAKANAEASEVFTEGREGEDENSGDPEQDQEEANVYVTADEATTVDAEIVSEEKDVLVVDEPETAEATHDNTTKEIVVEEESRAIAETVEASKEEEGNTIAETVEASKEVQLPDEGPPLDAPPSPKSPKSHHSHKHKPDSWKRPHTDNHLKEIFENPTVLQRPHDRSQRSKESTRIKTRDTKPRRPSLSSEERQERRRRKEARKAEETTRIQESSRRRAASEERHRARRQARKAADAAAATAAKLEQDAAALQAEARRLRRHGLEGSETRSSRRERESHKTGALPSFNLPKALNFFQGNGESIHGQQVIRSHGGAYRPKSSSGSSKDEGARLREDPGKIVTPPPSPKAEKSHRRHRRPRRESEGAGEGEKSARRSREGQDDGRGHRHRRMSSTGDYEVVKEKSRGFFAGLMRSS